MTQLTFPVSDRIVYGRNPLAEVICQFRFPRIFDIEQNLPIEFQKRVASDFPLAESRVTYDGLSADAISRRSVFDFTTAGGETKVSLASDFVAVTSLAYSSWPAFRASAFAVLDVVREIYGVSLLTRLGLRYRNVVDRDALGLKELGWHDLVRPELIGLLVKDSIVDSLVSEVTVSHLVKVGPGFVRVNSGLVKSQNGDDQAFMIDCDFFCEEQFRIENNVPTEILDRYHTEAGNLFRWCVRDSVKAALATV